MRKLCLPLRRILLSFSIVAAMALVMINTARAADSLCQVTGLRGTASLEHAGVSSALAAGMALSPGDTIQTDAGARVKLHFADGSEVRLGENAQLRIDAVTIDTAAGTRNILLRLPMGLLRAAAAKLSQSTGSSFEIHTDVGYSAVRGTHWIVVARQAETRVYVQEGRVAVGADFTTDQFPKLVEAGHWVSVSQTVGIGAVQVSPPGSVDGLIEQTEASLVPGTRDDVLESVTETAGNIPGAATDAVSGVTGAISGLAGAAVGQANTTVSNVTGAVAGVTGAAVDQTSAAASKTTDAVASTANAAASTVTSTTTAVTGALGLSGSGGSGSSGGSSGSGSGSSNSGGKSLGGSVRDALGKVGGLL
jgi:hypothetical protein